MVIESFPSHYNISLSLNRTNCYGMKPLNVNRNIGFNRLGLTTLEEALSVVSLRSMAWIDSLPEVQIPELSIEDSREQKAAKVMNMQWTSPRKQMSLYLLQNQEEYLLGSFAILHPSGYPYTQYNLMEVLDPVNDRFLISNDFDLGIKIEDAGYGYLNGNDKIIIFGSVEKIVTAYAPTITTNSINYGDDDMIAQDFLTAMFAIAEGTVKPGYTGGVTYSYSQPNETISGTFIIPAFKNVDTSTGIISFLAKDAFNPPGGGGGSTPQDTAPTNITLSNSTINENVAPGATVGVFTSSGGYGSNTFTYSLVSGTGSTDNSSFTITGNALTINASPDYETKTSYSIRVQVTDGNNLSYQKPFTVSVTDVEESTNIYLSSTLIPENAPVGTIIGYLTQEGSSSDQLTYSLVSGSGDTDNSSFAIYSNSIQSVLQSNAIFDHETKDVYSVRIRVTDGNANSFEKSFTISIGDIPEGVSQDYLLLYNNGTLDNRGYASSISITNNGCILDGENIAFDGVTNFIDILDSVGFNLNENFSFSFIINSLAPEADFSTMTIADFRQGTNIQPRIRFSYDSLAGSSISISQGASTPMQILAPSTFPLLVTWSRIAQTNKIFFNDQENSEEWIDGGLNFFTTKIRIGASAGSAASSKFSGIIKGIKLTYL